MENYNKKLDYCIKHQGGICPICEKELSGKIDLHHKIHNTKGNRKLYPELLDSVINLVALHNTCHLKSGNKLKMSDLQAREYEMLLFEYPEISERANLLN